MVQLGVVAVVTISVLVMRLLVIVLCLRRRAHHHCGVPDPSRTLGRTPVDFSCTPPVSQRFWKVKKHGAFSIPRQALSLRANDQICHHEKWLHLQFVDWSNQWNHQAHYDGNIPLKERPGSSGIRAPKRNIREVLSDHSLSS